MNELSGPRRWAVLASVFLISFAVLAFEVSITRIFSVLFSYHYAFLTVSGAVCGLGLGGFAWHLLGRRRKSDPREAGWAALGFALLIPASIILLFGAPSLLAAHFWSAVIPLLPFIFAGAFFAEVFRQRAAESGRLYQADLGGAALAALLVVPLIGLTGALNLVFLLGALAALGASSWAVYRANRGLLIAALITLALLLACWPLSARSGFLRIRPLPSAPSDVAKLMLTVLGDHHMTARILDTEWSAYARTDLVRYDLPNDGVYSLQIFTDADTPSLMMPFKGDLEQISYLRTWLPYVAFDMPPNSTMLSVGPGAGLDFLWGALAGFEVMDGVEINASLVRMMDRYQHINGDLYHYPGVTVTVEDGRSFVRRSRQRYDLITCSLTQTATTGNVGHALVESFIHTQEAFADYFEHLTPDGRYAMVTQSEHLLLRGAFTAIAVMGDQGVEPAQACQHLLALSISNAEVSESPYRYLLIWTKSPLTPADILPAMRAIEAGLAELVFIPGLGGNPLLDHVSRGDVTPEEVFAAGLSDRELPIDLRPATDDHPFFLDLSAGVPGALKWLLVGSFGAGLLFSLALTGTRYRREPDVQRWLLYFSALGVGFMLVEIPLIQKLILFLGHPTVSLAAILFYVLIGASVGSRISQRWSLECLPQRVALAGLCIALLGLLYALSLSHFLNLFLHWPLTGRLLILGVLLLPLGIALGIPFPSGLRLMSVAHQGEIPWMWGINGLMSVAGSALAAVGAKLFGFNMCLLAAAALYGALALSLRWLIVVPSEQGAEPPREPRGKRKRPAGKESA